jgi:phasin family protein
MQTQFFEMYRASLKSAADMMTASLEGAQRLQQQQLDLLHTAIEEQSKSVREIAEVRSVDELMAVQTRLTGTQMERAMDFWTRMWRTAGDNQAAIIGRAQSQLGQVRDSMRDIAVPHTQSEQQRKQQERKSA